MVSSPQNILEELKVNRLPSLPHVLVDMLHACQGSHASFQSMSAIISRDAAIAARVVSLANSSFYNRGTKINSLERALLVLGTDTIKTIVITASVQQFFSGFNKAHASYLKQFWKRSLSCALISKSLAILTGYPNPEEAYLTGLLHNIGELVLETNYTTEFEQLLRTADIESERIKLERELFSVNHADVGSWLAKEWGLGDFTADAIEFHHAQAESIQDAHHLVKLIHLASVLSDENPENQHSSLDVADTLFELNASLVNEITLKIAAEVVDVAASLGIDINASATENQDKQADPNQIGTDQEKHIALAKQVRNIGLLQTATGELNRATSRLELSRAFQTSLELLFGYPNSAVFWYQAKSNELSFSMSDLPDSAAIKFKREANRSLIATSTIQNKILCSLKTSSEGEPLPVVDQQILRMLKASGLVCIPVQTDESLFCVLVVGTDQILENTDTQYQLLQFFSAEIALACKATLKHISASENEITVQELSMRANEIAHEANNPLNIIGNYLATLSNKLIDQTDVQQELKILKEEVERTGQIILRLKDLQSDSIEQEPGVEINNEINNLITLYKNSLFLTHNIQCELALDPLLKRNQANRNSLKQILTNLIRNAVEAMPDGGSITITTSSSVNVNGSDFVEILIKDTGNGIPKIILKDLFKPVTSTKGKGNSGLGLSITKTLVTDAKGTISCRSSNNGTEFQILLPANS